MKSGYPIYATTRKAVYDLVLSIYQRLNPLEVNRKMDEWFASKSCKKYLHSCYFVAAIRRASFAILPNAIRLFDLKSERRLEEE
jgi:hypothetical protein